MDVLFEGMNLDSFGTEDKHDWSTLSFALPAQYKDKYNELQHKTNRRAGKLIKEILKKAIDRVDKEFGQD